MAAKLSNSSKEEVDDYMEANSYDSLAKLKNKMFSELKPEDQIQIYKYVDTNYHKDELPPLGD